MQRAPRFQRYWLAGLFFVLSPILPPVATTCAAPVVQADVKTEGAGETTPKKIADEQNRIFSGPQVGEKLAPFKVLQIKDDKPKELEIIKKPKDATLICFVHKISGDDRILYGLPLVDFYAAKQKRLTSHFVLLSDDRAKMLKMLRPWSRGAIFRNAQVGLSVDGTEGPDDYGLNRNVAMTVLVAKDGKVVHNMALEDPNARDLEKIMVAVAEATDQPKPKMADVQKELRAERKKQMDKRLKASPVFKIAPNEELGRLMFGVVNGRGNRSLVVKLRSKQIGNWVGDSADRKAELKKYCKAILASDIKLDQYAKAGIQQLEGE